MYSQLFQHIWIPPTDMNYIVPSGYKQLGEDEGEENLGIGFAMTWKFESFKFLLFCHAKLAKDKTFSKELEERSNEEQLHCPVAIQSGETMCQIFFEMLLPFLFAGIGMVLGRTSFYSFISTFYTTFFSWTSVWQSSTLGSFWRHSRAFYTCTATFGIEG